MWCFLDSAETQNEQVQVCLSPLTRPHQSHSKKAIIVLRSELMSIWRTVKLSIIITVWPSCHVLMSFREKHSALDSYLCGDKRLTPTWRFLCVFLSRYVVVITLQPRGGEDVRKQVRVEEDLHSPVQLTSGKNKFGKQNKLRSRSSV